MSRQVKIIFASLFIILGVILIATTVIGGGDLKAGSVENTGYDLSTILLWSGFGSVGISAFLFVLAGKN
ncbi:hypothetical protein HY844_03055 [Candidatus Berkelbacteria bacterium]|nr:hypothetical protein [Candidatus Berkelbacteria bacterium]